VEDALEMRIAYPQLAHVREGMSDIVDRSAALADTLRDEPRAAV